VSFDNDPPIPCNFNYRYTWEWFSSEIGSIRDPLYELFIALHLRTPFGKSI